MAERDAWVAKVKSSPNKLGLDNYGELSKPSAKDPVKYFSNVEPVLYAAVMEILWAEAARRAALTPEQYRADRERRWAWHRRERLRAQSQAQRQIS